MFLRVLDKKFSQKNIRDIIQYFFKSISEIDQKPCIADCVSPSPKTSSFLVNRILN